MGTMVIVVIEVGMDMVAIEVPHLYKGPTYLSRPNTSFEICHAVHLLNHERERENSRKY